MKNKDIIISALMLLIATVAQAQINIQGNVYGGARQANVGGSTHVTIGAEYHDVIINAVFGGSDVSGTIGNAKEEGDVSKDATVVTVKEAEGKHIFIGQLYGGGNGDYEYTSETTGEGESAVTTYKATVPGTNTVVASSTKPFVKPELKRASIDIGGGTYGYVFGGGNNATIKEETDIAINNTSAITKIADQTGLALLTKDRLKEMGINTSYYTNNYLFSRVFGGNNKADMAIRPTWNLQAGSINKLYSGGNEGRMTNPQGILLEIGKKKADGTIEESAITVEEVYGGCRKADVRPMLNGVDVIAKNLPGYNFPDTLAARVLIRSGNITHVYGGNDVKGRVYGGNALGIYTSIKGNLFGGGNGSYAYTDNADFKNDLLYGDFYYEVPNDKTSVQALNDTRPNAEQVSIHVSGTKNKPTIIRGSIYCGGNSATLKSDRKKPLVELKMGSYVIADNVFLGNNGAEMVTTDILAKYANNNVADANGATHDFSQMTLTDDATFATYMEGAALDLIPKISFDNEELDGVAYEPYSSKIGSFFCGGNVGSMTYAGTNTMNFDVPAYIYTKVVGGCNNAVVPQGTYNARYEGGILGTKEEQTVNSSGYSFTDSNGNIQNRLILNFNGLQLLPQRWNADNTDLEWNTWIDNSPVNAIAAGAEEPFNAEKDLKRRFKAGHIYGGCYSSGIVNGNVVINLNSTTVDRTLLFDKVKEDEEGEASLYGDDVLEQRNYTITERRTGVILDQQGMDVLGAALNVFGGGKGKDTEIWGSTTINLNAGYTFQVFGGSEEGVIGRPNTSGTYAFNGKTFSYDSRYSCYVNLCGTKAGVSKQADQSEAMAECEFMYGGGFFGPIAGNTVINLGKGRIFNSFAGSCNADILGHTETYIGRQVKNGPDNYTKYLYKNSFATHADDPTYYEEGFPWIRDYTYGGNDLGGKILSAGDFSGRVRETGTGAGAFDVLSKVHKNNDTDVLTANAYTEYLQGRAEGIFGGCYGTYDYTNPKFSQYFYTTGGEGTTAENLSDAKPGFSKPYMVNAFVNFRPTYTQSNNKVNKIFGAGQGYPGEKERDNMQDRSYVLIDIPQDMTNYSTMEVFGAGSWGGVGMKTILWPNLTPTDEQLKEIDGHSAIIDLVRGQIGAAYGGSYEEGITRRTVVNVPSGSTIMAGSIFGGAYGTKTLPSCDVLDANVEYHSANATLIYDPESSDLYQGALYGGNNNERRTLSAYVNIDVPLVQKRISQGQVMMTNGTIYGAGRGENTWSEYTMVDLKEGAKVWEVYGGGQMGHVLNAQSVQAYMQAYKSSPSPDIKTSEYEGVDWETAWKKAWSIGQYYTPNAAFNDYAEFIATKLNAIRPRTELDSKTAALLGDGTTFFNTNVIINKGATVMSYAYGGGLGKSSVARSGDIWGTTYIALLGGTVNKDLYAAGTSGGVYDAFGVGAKSSANPTGFIASANAYIKGGTARNIYGGGWAGNVGYHDGGISADTSNDIDGETHVVIGDPNGTSLTNGIPAIERNAYGGGEGGAVWGTTNITLNNGYIGYRYHDDWTDNAETTEIDEHYEEKINDETRTDGILGTLNDSGCLFGGGYIDNSSVDVTNVKMYGGHVRNAIFGGGEIAAIGRGVIHASGPSNSIRTLQGIYKAGKTNIDLYNGHVHRNVFGGGRGYNNLGEGGTLYSDGYVFGQTEVHIYGGEVGTLKELALGNGNVFGGGDIGYVYSAYEYDDNGTMKLGRGIKSGNRYDDGDEGYYYKTYADGTFEMDGTEKVPTEDCKVLIEPHCKVLSPVKINGHNYAVGDYVPTSDLHYLENKTDDATRWGSLDVKGIIIHNAIFAGGNTSSGSSKAYANATSVFGNATASVHDVYHRDLITVGTGHTGGLYGDGNLTFVDGYRGLNITNYGTDYYTIGSNREITIDQYHALDEREQAYYELRYICLQECTDKDETTYHPADPSNSSSRASTLNADDLLTLFEGVTDNGTPIILVDEETGVKTPNPLYWKENGVCTIYAGRIMNTIQRADFCGVFGSRMVMQGAQDRVPEVVDYTNYTINRVREVSLNKQHSVIDADKVVRAGGSAENEEWVNMDKAVHGNYFGIYNIVNFLGALTSDVHFSDKRVTENTTNEAYFANGNTYYQWKENHKNDRTRNNGSSLNKVALASGVYLELTTEKSTGNDLYEKDWGYITGIIELDLINVQTGIGGGFVYAKNVHGAPTYNPKPYATLTALNKDAITRRDFTYSTSMNEWETSGNFVHSTQTIIDDCYNISGKYQGSDAVPAHYWYIQGQVYVYDQYVSAYTGSPNAYSETVDIPLTITAASHGSMKLLNVKPNKYAYWKSNGVKLEKDQKMVVNDVTYELNTPISYWDWYLLSKSEKNLFVDETYVSVAECKIGDTTYPAGTVLLPDEYDTWKSSYPTVHHVDKNEDVDFTYVFRPSNNLGHDTGYILTYKVNNPTEWNTWYTPKSDADGNKINSETYNATSTDRNKYNDGPTYHLTSGTAEVLGQREYVVSNLISADVYNTYNAINDKSAIPAGQAKFESAWLVTNAIDINDGSHTSHLNPGTAVAKSEVTDQSGNVLPAYSGSVAPAYICTSTIQLSKTEFIYLNTRMTEAEKTAYYNRFANGTAEDKLIAKDINDLIVPAYYCTKEGLYGGDYYEAGKNYRGLAAWCSMSESDRQKFTFNYDALDLLIDPTYGGSEGEKYQYDGQGFSTAAAAKANAAGYSLPQALDYSASYNGTSDLTYTDKNGAGHTIATGTDLNRTAYEAIPNEQRHYAPITVQTAGSCYVVNAPLLVGNTPYAVGTTVTADIYNSLSDNDKNCVTELRFTDDDIHKTFYFCRESYTVGENGEGVTIENAPVTGSQTGTFGANQVVPVGLVINSMTYGGLTNKQKFFTIHGIAPTETSTLFVSRNSDIFDLSTEKIITVIYQYDYEEGDAAGNVTPISERHVVNIHVTFKSGVPSVEDIKAPQIILPGDFIGLREPNVTPGAYEVTGGGWELFEKESDAESHVNGIEYTPTFDPLYWYQDGYYVAYYAKTYLGKTYSNHVPVSVANYHDLAKVMGDNAHHYYVDIPDLTRLKRVPKVYINTQDGVDQLKNLFDLSLLDSNSAGVENGVVTADGPLKGHALLNSQVKGASNLEFFLRTDIDHSKADGTPAEWTPIANGSQCFEGKLNGDGHTISNLTGSLFGKLCGEVYNLGVTGPFTSAGVADTGTGYVENCWVKSTATSGFNGYAVFGNPSRTGTDLIQVVNCYYPKSNNYNVPASDAHGQAKQMPDKAFYNGEVAYDLNGFYLYKRYCDQQSSLGSSTTDYQYYTMDGDAVSAPTTGHYGNDAKYCSAGYVEDRYADGDFVYSGGNIPDGTDSRRYVDANGLEKYYPIWPNDYLFFGQALNYGHVEGLTHQEVPTAVTASNRVYRAPAYYRNSTMGVAHFNPAAVFAQTKNGDASIIAYKDMTAIDFSGGNGDLEGGYQKGLQGNKFYPPLLDDGGLTDFQNIDLTRNLLVYTTAQGTTANVVSGYLTDWAYEETDNKYRTVKAWDSYFDDIRGHWVQEQRDNKGQLTGYIATRDHLLVDRNDFNAPISYSFDDDHRMWYQRMPDNFVDIEKGWESVSLPFTAELVTTQTKGELTHFYEGNTTGHEYWLREFKGNVKPKSGETNIYTADFNVPAAGTSNKKVTNTFLWDYYYKDGHNQTDRNQDTYQTYYKDTRYYEGYPRLANGTPYLIGFPGDTYYEFDLSGNWKANTTAATSPIGLDESQVITFASATAATVSVSDNEKTGVTSDGLTFHPSYLNEEFAAGTENTFTLATDGSSYTKVPATGSAVKALAFRPYFTGTVSGARSTRSIEQILFSKGNGSFGVDETSNTGKLSIWPAYKKIMVSSSLKTTANVRITNLAGITIASFTIEPGETVETRVNHAAVYIVQTDDNHYMRKLSVR